jgi:hypothetical protein
MTLQRLFGRLLASVRRNEAVVTITRDHIDMLETSNGGFKRSSLAAVGVLKEGMTSGWRRRLEGTSVKEEQLALAIHFSETGNLSKTGRKEELRQALCINEKACFRNEWLAL